MRSLVRWFVGNPIAANILMLALLFSGIISYGELKREVFPRTDVNVIQLAMNYPGAAPAEVEQQIVVRIEEAISDVPGIFRIGSESREGVGLVNVEITDGYDLQQVLNAVKTRVDAIITFPVASERPVIQQLIFRDTLMWFSISGNADMTTLKEIGYQIRDEMPLLEGVSEVKVVGMFIDEMAIEISEENLRRFNLTFTDVADAIRQSSINVPAGTIKSPLGNVQIQTREQAYVGDDFANIVVRSLENGSQLLLQDVATIDDGYAEQDFEFILNDKTALNFEVKISDDPDLINGTINARAYLEEMKKTLPEGLVLKIGYESKSIFDSRFNLLKNNALAGLALVFIILMLFLRPLLAFWVVVGIATAFFGAIALMGYFDVSLNMNSIFAFLLVLGIVVDDAIIVGESIFRRQREGVDQKAVAIEGTVSVLMPVLLAVISTIIFFLPILDVPDYVRSSVLPIFLVVFFCLIFSLIESLFILPSHLSHMKPEVPGRIPLLRQLSNVRHMFSNGMENFASNTYLPVLNKALRRPQSAILIFFMMFFASISLLVSGWVGSAFFPQVPQPYVNVNVSFPEGSPYKFTTDLVKHMKVQAEAVKNDPDLLAKNKGKPFIFEVNTTADSNSAGMFVGLTAVEKRHVSTEEVTEKLRELIGPIPEAKSYSLDFSFGDNSPDIQLDLRMTSNLGHVQRGAVADIQKVLSAYAGVSNVRSDLDTGRLEVEVSLRPYAETLGLTMADIATQMRQSFYGDEVQRIPRSKEDVKVMLRYSESERRTLDTLDTMRIRTRDRIEVPLLSVANIELVPGASTIKRTDRYRNITITADVLDGQDPSWIVQQMLDTYSEQWRQEYSGFSLSAAGKLRTQEEFGDKFNVNFLLAFLVALALFAIAFKSVFEPFLVLLAVPFGFMGAIIGHLLLGHPISMMSFIGFLACSGVVVNDNLVLLDRVRHLRGQGADVMEAITRAGVDRFRPIVLTSMTTFFGLLPVLFEQSTQARFLIPMAISLSFGILFSSGVTLIMVPCAYISGHSLGDAARRLTRSMWQRARSYLL